MADFLVNGTPWSNQFRFNTSQTAALGSFTKVTAAGPPVSNAQVIVTNSKAICFGGNDYETNSPTADILSATITAGAVGSFSVVGSLPSTRYGHRVIRTTDKVYLIGGWSSSNWNRQNSVHYATINGDGTIGSWSAGPTLPEIAGDFCCFATKNRVYIVGNYNQHVFYSVVDASGFLGAWQAADDFPFGNFYGASCAVIGDSVYVFGGAFDGESEYGTIIHTAPIAVNGEIGAWSVYGTLTVGRSFASAVASAGRLWLIGGNDGYDSYSSAPISGGVIGTFATASALPAIILKASAIITSTRLHIIGSYDYVEGPETYTPYLLRASFTGGFDTYTEAHTTIEGQEECQGQIVAQLPIVSGTAQTTDPIYRAVFTGKPWSNQFSFNLDQTAALDTFSSVSNSTVNSRGRIAITKHRIYSFGGINEFSLPDNRIYSAPLVAGVVGTWVLDAVVLPYSTAEHEIIKIGNRLYLIGGWDGSQARLNTYYCEIDDSGIIGSWSAGPSLPNGISGHHCFATKFADEDHRVYLLTYHPTLHRHMVLYSPIVGGELTAWVVGSDMNIGLMEGTSILLGETVYYVGGKVGGTATDKVHKAQVVDGVLGSWSEHTQSLPVVTRYPAVAATAGRLFVLGGMDAIDVLKDSVYSAPISGEVVGAFSTDSLLSAAQTNGEAAVTQGRLYLIGDSAVTGGIAAIEQVAFTSGHDIYADVAGEIINQASGVIVAQKPVLSGTAETFGSFTEGNFTNGQPWVFQPWNDTDSDTAWQAVTPFTAESHPVKGSSAFLVTDNKVYAFGGLDVLGNATNIVQVAPIVNGVIGTWSPYIDSLPEVRYRATALRIGNRVYLVGGRGATAKFNTKVLYAEITPTGEIGLWSESLPVPHYMPEGATEYDAIGTVFVTKNRLCVMVGMGSTTRLFWATIAAGGVLTEWLEYPYVTFDGVVNYPYQTIPISFRSGNVAVFGDTAYHIGGEVNGVVSYDIYSTPITYGETGGWTLYPESIGVGSPRRSFGIASIASRLWVFGGIDNASSPSSQVVSTLVTGDVIDTFAGFIAAYPLDDPDSGISTVITSSRIYLFGASAQWAPFIGGLDDYPAEYSYTPGDTECFGRIVALNPVMSGIAERTEENFGEIIAQRPIMHGFCYNGPAIIFSTADGAIVAKVPVMHGTEWSEVVCFGRIITKPPKMKVSFFEDAGRIIAQRPVMSGQAENPIVINGSIASRRPVMSGTVTRNEFGNGKIVTKRAIMRGQVADQDADESANSGRIVSRRPVMHGTAWTQQDINVTIRARKPKMRGVCAIPLTHEVISFDRGCH